MATSIELFVPLDELDGTLESPPRLLRLAERILGRSPGSLGAVRILRRSLDARKNRPLGFRLRCLVGTTEAELEDGALSAARPPRPWPIGKPHPRVVIVGSGPAGTWAALRLAEAGLPVTILERGKPVQPRRADLAALTRGHLDPESNYCYGEGGAGTFSDGKLYTRSKDREAVASVLHDLVRFGAPADVEIESRPHVGSNRLPKVLTSLRQHLEGLGVVYRFSADVASVRFDQAGVRAVALRDGDELPADAVVLAVGHSARSIYEWAAAAGIALERKPIAVGVRIEHPQGLIDEIQYGRAAGHPRLPPAMYELASTGAGRGVYSFCMCPGGWIVPAATEADGVVVNGMSLSKRDSRFANAGLVVAVESADFGPDGDGPLAGVAFQRGIERAAARVGGGGFRAPGVRVDDFLADRTGGALSDSSYRPGVTPAKLGDVFPPFVVTALREGLRRMGAQMPRFLHPQATLIAAETRTSAPVRFLRDPRTLMSPSCPGLFPAGEGAGYAGGIVSAALDGLRIADQLLAMAE
ncbi:MAG TPA: FAD-dependent oxidoreductase [Polyangia bacterium]|jgi:hypothetical protein